MEGSCLFVLRWKWSYAIKVKLKSENLKDHEVYNLWCLLFISVKFCFSVINNWELT